jgi:hypothetical protein
MLINPEQQTYWSFLLNDDNKSQISFEIYREIEAVNLIKGYQMLIQPNTRIPFYVYSTLSDLLITINGKEVPPTVKVIPPETTSAAPSILSTGNEGLGSRRI